MSCWHTSAPVHALSQAGSKSCSEPRYEKPHHPALHCHFPGRLLLLAVPGMTSKEARENIHFPQALPREKNIPLLVPFQGPEFQAALHFHQLSS